MPMQTRVAQVIDALVTGMRARSGYRSPAAFTAGTTVFDGPEVWLHFEPGTTTYLVIGWPGEADDVQPAANTVLANGPQVVSVHPRDETATISCLAVCSHGDAEDGDPKVARDGALAVIADVADLCRADPSLGLDTSGVVGGIRTRAWVTAGQLTQYAAEGCVCEWAFTVTFQSRV